MAPTFKAFHIFLPLLCFVLFGHSFAIPSASNTTAVHQGIDDHDWSIAVRKGHLLYQNMQSGCFPDKKNPITLAQLEAQGWTFSEGTKSEPSFWPPNLSSWEGFSKSVVMKMGWSLSKDYMIGGIGHGNG